MFKTPQVKHPYTAISPAAHEHINTISTKSNVKDLFIVSDKLSLGRQSRNIPYRAGCVDARSDDQAW